MRVEDILALLKEKNCRITKQRRLILMILIEHQSIVLSADEILAEASQSDPTINLTTVYRNLELLQELDLLYFLNRDSKITSYKLKCHAHHHHHLTCTQCGKMIPIDYCPISEELLETASKEGYQITGHTLELFGLCHECRAQFKT